MNYNDYVDKLRGQHGECKYPYKEWWFDVKLKKSVLLDRNKKDGLVVHHIMENEISNCCDLKKHPLKEKCHKAENLVYCNSMEHLILHLMIVEEYERKDSKNVIPLLLWQSIKDFPYWDYYEWYDKIETKWGWISKYLDKYKRF